MISTAYSRTLLMLTALLPLCACSVALEKKGATPTVYLLQPEAVKHENAIQTPRTIKVIKPSVAEGLDTMRIAVLEENRRLKYLEQAQWAGELGKVVQRFVIESVNTIPNVTALGEEDYSLRTDYRLLTDIRAMQAEYANQAGVGTPSVHLAAQFILVDYNDNDMVAMLDFDERIEASSNSATAIVEAYEALLRKATKTFIVKVGNI